MMNGKPLVIDGLCGLGGWSEGFLAEGWECVGIDIEKHDYGTGGYPGGLILQDMLTVDGRQFKDADCLVFSPPCQKYSYMAMPWTRAKKLAEWYRESSVRIAELNALFDACFRIQLEASKAAGRYIPMVIENVRGAQRWVGRARWNFGSFYLWGDVPALMPQAIKSQKFNPDGTAHPPGSWFAIADSKNRADSGQKVPGFRFDGSGRSFQSASVSEHLKVPSEKGRRTDPGKGARFTSRDCGVEASTKNDEVKQHGSGPEWFDNGIAKHSSGSNARKQASAMIAKIPFPLAQYIARVYKPTLLT